MVGITVEVLPVDCEDKMTTRNDASTTSTSGASMPEWLRPDWDGPTVELRPPDAGPEWPPGSMERIVYRADDFPQYPFQQDLPATTYFGADGWPLTTPESVKPGLDPRCQADLRRYPWSCCREPMSEFSWAFECGNAERFRRFNRQALILTGREPRRSRAVP